VKAREKGFEAEIYTSRKRRKGAHCSQGSKHTQQQEEHTLAVLYQADFLGRTLLVWMAETVG